MTACSGLNRVCLFPALVSRRCNYVGASSSANCCIRAYFIPIRVKRVVRTTRILVYPQLREINLDPISGGPPLPRQRFFPTVPLRFPFPVKHTLNVNHRSRKRFLLTFTKRTFTFTFVNAKTSLRILLDPLRKRNHVALRTIVARFYRQS